MRIHVLNKYVLYHAQTKMQDSEPLGFSRVFRAHLIANMDNPGQNESSLEFFKYYEDDSEAENDKVDTEVRSQTVSLDEAVRKNEDICTKPFVSGVVLEHA